jgi:hypothetical protein
MVCNYCCNELGPKHFFELKDGTFFRSMTDSKLLEMTTLQM